MLKGGDFPNSRFLVVLVVLRGLIDTHGGKESRWDLDHEPVKCRGISAKSGQTKDVAQLSSSGSTEGGIHRQRTMNCQNTVSVVSS